MEPVARGSPPRRSPVIDGEAGPATGRPAPGRAARSARGSGRRDRIQGDGVTRVVAVLLTAAVVLIGLSLATRYGAYRIEVADPSSPALPGAKALMRLFDVSSERNVPTWYSSSLLLGCGLLAGVVGLLARRAGTGGLGQWAMLSVLLLVLSLDEAAALHERLRGPTADMLGARARGALRFAWVIPGALLVAAVGAVSGRFVWRLPPRSRRLVVAGAALFLLGALGLEMLSAAVLDALGDRALYIVVTAAEEGLEMAGAILVLAGLLRLVRVERLAGGYQLVHATT